MGHLGNPLTRPVEPLRTTALRLSPGADVLTRGPTLPKRLPRPSLRLLLHRGLVVCQTGYHYMGLQASGAVVWHQEGGQVGPVWRAGVCGGLFCVYGALGVGECTCFRRGRVDVVADFVAEDYVSRAYVVLPN